MLIDVSVWKFTAWVRYDNESMKGNRIANDGAEWRMAGRNLDIYEGSWFETYINLVELPQQQTRQERTKLPSDKDLENEVKRITDICKDFLKELLTDLDKNEGKAHRDKDGNLSLVANLERIKVKEIDYTGKIWKKYNPGPAAAIAVFKKGKRAIYYVPKSSNTTQTDLLYYGYKTVAELLHHSKEDKDEIYGDDDLDESVTRLIGQAEAEKMKREHKASNKDRKYHNGQLAHTVVNRKCQ